MNDHTAIKLLRNGRAGRKSILNESNSISVDVSPLTERFHLIGQIHFQTTEGINATLAKKSNAIRKDNSCQWLNLLETIYSSSLRNKITRPLTLHLLLFHIRMINTDFHPQEFYQGTFFLLLIALALCEMKHTDRVGG